MEMHEVGNSSDLIIIFLSGPSSVDWYWRGGLGGKTRWEIREFGPPEMGKGQPVEERFEEFWIVSSSSLSYVFAFSVLYLWIFQAKIWQQHYQFIIILCNFYWNILNVLGNM